MISNSLNKNFWWDKEIFGGGASGPIQGQIGYSDAAGTLKHNYSINTVQELWEKVIRSNSSSYGVQSEFDYAEAYQIIKYCK